MVAAVCSSDASSLERLQSQFLGLLPKIETHARIYFRNVTCPDQRADRIAETVALAWKWLVRLHERGKDISRFPMVFVSLVAKAVKCGRRATGMDSARDVLSPVAQRRRGFSVERLAQADGAPAGPFSRTDRGQVGDVFEDRLNGNTKSRVIDQVVFRVDFRAWLLTLTDRERKLIRAMILNERTRDLATKFHVSPGRISQVRRDFRNGWRRYCRDDS